MATFYIDPTGIVPYDSGVNHDCVITFGGNPIQRISNRFTIV